VAVVVIASLFGTLFAIVCGVVALEDDNEPAHRLYAESGYTLVEGYRPLTLPLSPDFRGS
jgi:hypothetical protein